MQEWTEFIKFFVGLLAIANPIGAVPIFLSLTIDNSEPERHRIAFVTSLSFAMILLVSLLIGQQLLALFGIDIPAFRTAGGVLILLMALAMVRAHESGHRHTKSEHAEATKKESVAVVPLAIPLLAGPGAISTVIVYAHQNTTLLEYGLIVAAIVAVAALVFVSLRLGPLLGNALGHTGMNIFTRIMGLILLAIGVEFISTGLASLWPGLSGG